MQTESYASRYGDRKERAFVRSTLSMAIMQNQEIRIGGWLVGPGALENYMKHHGLIISNVLEVVEGD